MRLHIQVPTTIQLRVNCKNSIIIPCIPNKNKEQNLEGAGGTDRDNISLHMLVGPR